jgi:cytochrome c peroxidase
MKAHLPLLFVLMSLVLASCRPTSDDPYTPTPYELPQPLFFPTTTNIPADNPMTEEGVELGEKLFFGSNLSPLTSHLPYCCASCHHPEFSFEGGPEATLEHLGTEHTMLPLINLAWNTTGLGWKGNVKTLEDMVYAAYTDPLEINADTAEVVRKLQQSDTYPELFQKAFGTDKIHFGLVEKAIAQYVRSLVFTDSKFDRYLRGEEQLTQDELNGYMLFITENGADCFHCHGGGSNALFTTNLLYNNGLDAAIQGDFKAPSLRNIALTAPYMHDGRFTTLDEVIDFYSDGVQYSEHISPLMHHVMQGGVHLTPEEKQQLKAFLLTLTTQTGLPRSTSFRSQ